MPRCSRTKKFFRSPLNVSSTIYFVLKDLYCRHVTLNMNTYLGSIPGELSFAANSRELARTRANSRELRANSPTVRQHRQSAELRRTFAGVRRTFAGVRRSSPGFARVRAHSAANSRTVRQKIRSPEEIYPPLTVVRREQVRGERKFWRTSSPEFFYKWHNSSLPRTSSPPANLCSPRTIVRRELMFAGGELVRRELMSYVHVRHKHPNGRLTTKQCNLPSSLRASRMAFTKSIAYRLFVSRCDPAARLLRSRAAPPRFAWRAPRRAAASRQQGLTTLGNILSRDFSFSSFLGA